MRLALAAALMFSLTPSAQAFQLPGDYGRFGPHDTAVLSRIDNDPTHIQVAAYGDAPAVHFLMDAAGARQCAEILEKAGAAPANPDVNAPAVVRCPAQTGAGVMQVFKRKDNQFHVEFSNSVPGNIVDFIIDEAGLAKAVAAFHSAASG